ncbi:hypothetical protein KJ641_01015 [Patescibacteria group bacterium]|nr:hypothetical protein [Patescibacteria group bacterium]MBU1895439.1 hypothetical protein [Patescibacteria group bacterium]
MIIFLYGPDTFRSRRQLKKMITKFKVDRDPQGLNVVSLDAEKAGPGEIISQVLAVPFLAEKRMVVVENLLVSKDQDLMKELLKRIEENNIPETNVLIFWEGTDKFKTKSAKEFFGRLQKEKYAQSFDEIVGIKLSAWIASEIKERGGVIDRPAIQYLAEHVGSDMWRLSSLLDQLVSYSEERSDEESFESKDEGINAKESKSPIEVSKPACRQAGISQTPSSGSLGITVGDVQLFLDQKADDNIFNLVDAIVGKQPKKVFQMIQQQYENGEDAQYIFAMILRQFRILIELRDMLDRENMIANSVLAQKLSLHPFVVQKSLPLAKRYSMPELKQVYDSLLLFDKQSKTSQGDQKVLLDIFVGRVTSQ